MGDHRLLNGLARRADQHGGCVISGVECALQSSPTCDFSGQQPRYLPSTALSKSSGGITGGEMDVET
ncbi:hypothetical protein DXU03_32530 [Rhizobium johnstonii]